MGELSLGGVSLSIRHGNFSESGLSSLMFTKSRRDSL
jgi:hypothetical protein